MANLNDEYSWWLSSIRIDFQYASNLGGRVIPT